MLSRRTIRKPDLLFVLTLLTGFGVLASTTVAAEESLFGDANLFSNAQFEDLLDGDVKVSGNRHAGLHLSSKSQAHGARYLGQHGDAAVSDSGVHLSWKLSW